MLSRHAEDSPNIQIWQAHAKIFIHPSARCLVEHERWKYKTMAKKILELQESKLIK